MTNLANIRYAFRGIGLARVYKIRWLDYKHVLIHLSNKQDFNRIWMKQHWFIANQKIRVFKWSPEFEAEKESPIILVWISFPNLKTHLYKKSTLVLIAKIVGKPLFVDEATARGSRSSVARVYIEYDCRNQLVDQIKDPKDSNVSVLNRFHAISEDDNGEQNVAKGGMNDFIYLQGEKDQNEKCLGMRDMELTAPVRDASLGVADGMLVHEPVHTDAEGSGEHVPIEGQGASQSRGSAGHNRGETSTTCSRQRMEGHVNNPSHMESTSECPIFAPFVYAKCSRTEKIPLWTVLRSLLADIRVPWLVGVDFNVILNRAERLYGASPHVGSMDDFAVTLLDCGLVDGGFVGNTYTWTNSHMFQHLDRIDLFEAVVDFFHGAEMPRGMISDNILLVQELMGRLDKKVRGGNLVIKLDMMKAYDHMECDFLYKMLEQFGFSPQWINIIQRCISNCWFSVLINGTTTGYFKSEIRNMKLCPDNALTIRRVVSLRIEIWQVPDSARLTLIRSVLSFLPIYLLQVLKPLACVIEKIEILFNNFMWGDFTEGKRIHWTPWQKITWPTFEGGLDIRNISNVVEAFGMKIWWRFKSCNSLWARFMRVKYCVGQVPRYVKPRIHDSQTWKRMLVSCLVTEQHMRWRIEFSINNGALTP
ncbi:Uncharacterized protein TCM_043834 [Theobroma cacao]|uniref:DUF4283 domain-containing protein n=1 Tax=Theobroma cacao TaxID=3641 RepID=A0A061FR21_THECC|nr:Uncharacterized protein TCM_043834 [Theobroma cacao]